MISRGDYLFVVVSWAVAATCVVVMAVAALLHYRRRGTWPAELKEMNDSGTPGPFVLIVWIVIVCHTGWPEKWLLIQPVPIIISALDASIFLALLAVAALALSVSFRRDWTKKRALQQTYFLVFAGAFGVMVYRDIQAYISISWIWILGILAACFLVPVFTRMAYVEYAQRYLQEAQPADTTAQAAPGSSRPE